MPSGFLRFPRSLALGLPYLAFGFSLVPWCLVNLNLPKLLTAKHFVIPHLLRLSFAKHLVIDLLGLLWLQASGELWPTWTSFIAQTNFNLKFFSNFKTTLLNSITWDMIAPIIFPTSLSQTWLQFHQQILHHYEHIMMIVLIEGNY